MSGKVINTPWWEFATRMLKSDELKGEGTQKERFAIISHQWKNQQAKLVTVNIEYIEELHSMISLLRGQVADLRLQTKVMGELLDYFEHQRVGGDCEKVE